MDWPKVISFDCYGTIIDWESEIQLAFKEILNKHGFKNVDFVELQRYWEEIQFDYIQKQYLPYVEVLKDTLSMTFNHFNYPFTKEDLDFFSKSMGGWQPFSDAKESLLSLKKHAKIALLTNTDDHIIQQTVHTLGVDFDEIVTAEQVRSYKANHDGFYYLMDKMGINKSDLLHVGFGFKYDVVPATEIGITSCWVNRYGETRPVDVREDYLVGDMKTLSLLVKGFKNK